jgi:protein tyrosine/serine phosphatase
MKRLSIILVGLLFVAIAARGESTNRLAAVSLTKPGVPNLHRISDRLYRSAQPSTAGFSELEKLGIKTVISLRAFHSDKKKIAATDLRYENINFNTWHPEQEDIVRFLKIVGDTNNHPILVHCQHGADRTGTMIAIYRIAVEGWSKKEALAEMTSDNFGFHKIWTNLTRYINRLDIDAVKQKAGIKPASR